MGYAAAHNAIRTRFNTQWTAGSYSAVPVAWANAEFDPPSEDEWVRVTIVDAAAFKVSFGGFIGAGDNYRHPGVVVVNIFVPLNVGDGLALAMADEIASIFRAWQDATTRTRFFTPYVTRVGVDGNWFQVNVTCPFDRDELL